MVHHLIAKLTALDPDAGSAVRVIARFDALIEGRAGLEPILRAVAALTGSPARLVDAEHRIDLRADVGGQVRHGVAPIEPQWLSAPLAPGGPPALWLERGGTYTLVDAMVMDRAAFATREVLHRTREATVPASHDPAAVEILLDAGASERARLHAARILGLRAGGLVRAIAVAGNPGRIEVVGTGRLIPEVRDAGSRTGIGPATTILELPDSWAQARTALAFAAEGTERDPGPSVVLAEELGALSLLAAGVDRAGPPVPDVRALEVAATAAPWVLTTLDAFCSHGSLRLAAAALFLHHSTLQDRITAIEHDLGWPVREPRGRLRLQLALAARRYLLHPVSD
jgi:hypothetical protein